VQPAVSWRG